MQELRRAQRRGVLKAAAISFDGGTISCTVRNLSMSGAALEVASTIGIPEQFSLVQVGRVFAKGYFNIRRRQPLQNIPDGRMRGRPFPAYLESLVQLSPMDLDEGADGAIRVGAAHDRQNGKQQDVRQLIEFAFGAPWIGDRREVRQKTFE